MGLLLGKLLPYLAIGFFELCMILTLMRFVFSVPIHGSVLLLALLSLPYIFVSLSLGILISSKAGTQAQAMQLAFLTILPSIFFSGYIFPRETMPKFFYVLSYFVPRHLLHQHHPWHYFTRRRLGASVDRRPGALHTLGTVLLVIAARRFQNKVIMA